MRIFSYAAIGLVLASLYASPAEAQSRQSKGRSSAQQQRQKQSQPPRRSISGQVVRTKKVGVRGAPVENLVVLLRTENDKKAIVDLGPVKGLKSMQIASGDQLKASGRLVSVEGKKILMAHQLQKNGRTAQIQRQRPSSQMTSDERRSRDRSGDRSRNRSRDREARQR